jgi:hypothetical protein
MPSEALASSLYERLIGKALAGGRADKAFQPRESMMFYVPLVKAECEFINITAKVLFAGVVIDAG